MIRIHLPTMPSFTHGVRRQGEIAFDPWMVPPVVVDEWLAEAWERMTFGGVGGAQSPIMLRLIGGSLNRRLVWEADLCSS